MERHFPQLSRMPQQQRRRAVQATRRGPSVWAISAGLAVRLTWDSSGRGKVPVS